MLAQSKALVLKLGTAKRFRTDRNSNVLFGVGYRGTVSNILLVEEPPGRIKQKSENP